MYKIISYFCNNVLIYIDMKKKEPHIKKPLNAFMIYMKDMRPVVQAECTLKESAAINQLLGRRVIYLSIFFVCNRSLLYIVYPVSRKILVVL